MPLAGWPAISGDEGLPHFSPRNGTRSARASGLWSPRMRCCSPCLVQRETTLNPAVTRKGSATRKGRGLIFPLPATLRIFFKYQKRPLWWRGMNKRSAEDSRDSEIILCESVTMDTCHRHVSKPTACTTPRVSPKLWPSGDCVSVKLHQLAQMSHSGEGC